MLIGVVTYALTSALLVEEEAAGEGSIGRGEYGLFSGQGLVRFDLCRWGEWGVGGSVGHSRLGSRNGSRGMNLVAEVVGGVVVSVVVGTVGCKDSLFGLRWGKSRLGRGRRRSQNLAAIETASDSVDVGSIAGGWERRLERIYLGFSSCRSVGPLCGAGVALSRNNRQ